MAGSISGLMDDGCSGVGECSTTYTSSSFESDFDGWNTSKFVRRPDSPLTSSASSSYGDNQYAMTRGGSLLTERSSRGGDDEHEGEDGSSVVLHRAVAVGIPWSHPFTIHNNNDLK